ncbi:MAG: hypothetical protein AAGH68_04570 [Pseudomonadota bacterium]
MSESICVHTRSRAARAERLAELRVRVGTAFFPVTKMSDNGFVITADGRPPLRGFADILMGNELVRHGLVTCAWHEGDQVGYEFKHATFAAPIAPDYAPASI